MTRYSLHVETMVSVPHRALQRATPMHEREELGPYRSIFVHVPIRQLSLVRDHGKSAVLVVYGVYCLSHGIKVFNPITTLDGNAVEPVSPVSNGEFV